MSSHNPAPLSFAQLLNTNAITISHLPNEVLDTIFEHLTSQELFPFLLQAGTHASALRALYRNPMRLQPLNAWATNIFRAIHILRRHRTVVTRNPVLVLTYPEHFGPDWHPGLSWDRAINEVLNDFSHWEDITIQIRHQCPVTDAGRVWYGHLQRLELIGDSSISHTVSLGWTVLTSSHRYELVLRNTLLAAPPFIPWLPLQFDASRLRAPTIHNRYWSDTIVSNLLELRFPSLPPRIVFSHLEAFSLTLDHWFSDARGLGAAYLVRALLPSRSTLRSLRFRGAFMHHIPLGSHDRVLRLPLSPFTALRELEMPLAHMQHVEDFLTHPSINKITFGIYFLDGLHLEWLEELFECLCVYYLNGPHSFPSIRRTIGFHLEVDRPPPSAASHLYRLRARDQTMFARLFVIQRRFQVLAARLGYGSPYEGVDGSVTVGPLFVDFSVLYRLARWEIKSLEGGVEFDIVDFRGWSGM